MTDLTLSEIYHAYEPISKAKVPFLSRVGRRKIREVPLSQRVDDMRSAQASAQRKVMRAETKARRPAVTVSSPGRLRGPSSANTSDISSRYRVSQRPSPVTSARTSDLAGRYRVSQRPSPVTSARTSDIAGRYRVSQRASPKVTVGRSGSTNDLAGRYRVSQKKSNRNRNLAIGAGAVGGAGLVGGGIYATGRNNG